MIQLPSNNSVSSSTKSGKLTQALFRRNASILHALNGEVHPLISYRGAIQAPSP